jgi:hexokinase
MGKGFLANKGLLGQDLRDLVGSACQRQGINVELQAILNDSSACLLSQSYSQLSTRFGVILGTGVNIAAYLPTTTIGHFKFGNRPPSWFEEATHVIVNTELGMFGQDILPLMKWDHQLLQCHPKPQFQPLEHLVSGLYLGELGRLALLDAIETTGVFGGIVPPSLVKGYTLGAETLALVERYTLRLILHLRMLLIEVLIVTHPPI